MFGKPWLEVLTESHDPEPEVTWLPCESWEDGSIVLSAIADSQIISEGNIEDVLKKLRADGWSTSGRSLGKILSEVDPRFINHAEHLQRLTKGGTRPDGTTFPGGGGLRWGGLLISDKEALLRVLGSYEYNDTQEQYQQTIRFANFHKIAKARGANWTEKARMLMNDRIKVHCDCPAFRYFYAYAATKKGFGLYPELRPSEKTNKTKSGGICKHLNLCLVHLPAQAQSIASEMKSHFGMKIKKKTK